MSGIAGRLKRLLDENGVSYETLHHPQDFRARDTAEDTHTPPKEFAKTVFVNVDDEYAMAVLPATHFVSETRLAHSLGAKQVRLASESQFEELCPDCEVGAAPPFGNLYGLPVYVSPALVEDEQITFNAGSHEEAIRLAYADFERLAAPRVVHMARHE
jgi:Ala-tRNA(Pro) deacylase